MGYRLIYIEKGNLIQRITHSLKPLPDWGPARPQVRFEWTHKTLKYYMEESLADMQDSSLQQFVRLCNNNENR
ncbi:unnamed protein product [Callosobruchus maculatus]|nr:unnamed protein product [Callosobruchus maculatus]